jgi:hypothetical protein
MTITGTFQGVDVVNSQQQRSAPSLSTVLPSNGNLPWPRGASVRACWCRYFKLYTSVCLRDTTGVLVFTQKIEYKVTFIEGRECVSIVIQ